MNLSNYLDMVIQRRHKFVPTGKWKNPKPGREGKSPDDLGKEGG